MSLLAQWRDEIGKFSHMSVVLYYGNERKANAASLTSYDVVITSYGTLTAEAKQHFKNKQPSLLLSIHWWRIILDEAHIIRNRTTETAKAVFQLRSDRLWCLTGTPIQNKLDDIYSLLRFLNEEPFSLLSWWKRVISGPFERGDVDALSRLKAILQPLMLRRTKNMTMRDGKSILTLPPRTDETITLEFTEAERDFYNALYSKTTTTLEGFVSRGLVLSKYVEILTLLLRLRQCCDHPYLVIGRERGEDEWDNEVARFISRFAGRTLRINQSRGSNSSAPSKEYLTNLANEIKKMKKAHSKTENETNSGASQADTNSDETVSSDVADDAGCPMCLTFPPEDGVLSPCGHWACRECIMPLFNERNNAMCPICRNVFSKDSLTALPKIHPLVAIDHERDWRHSSKTQRLLNDLIRQRAEDPQVKCLIFSQWTSMLDLIQIPLKREKFPYLRLDGTLTQKQRETILQAFSTDSRHNILLISLKAGGVGLNLVRASVVYFMDAWWNPAVEQQAIQRVHRIGQKRPVFVKRYVVSHTVEERIIEMSSRKEMLAQSLHQTDDQAKTIRANELVSLFKDWTK